MKTQKTWKDKKMKRQKTLTKKTINSLFTQKHKQETYYIIDFYWRNASVVAIYDIDVFKKMKRKYLSKIFFCDLSIFYFSQSQNLNKNLSPDLSF